MNLSIKCKGRKQETIFLCLNKIIQGSFFHITFQILQLKDCGSFQFTSSSPVMCTFRVFYIFKINLTCLFWQIQVLKPVSHLYNCLSDNVYTKENEDRHLSSLTVWARKKRECKKKLFPGTSIMQYIQKQHLGIFLQSLFQVRCKGICILQSNFTKNQQHSSYLDTHSFSPW